MIKGQRQIQINMNRALIGITNNVKKGLFNAGDIVKKSSEDLTSIDTSRLIKSTFNTPSGTKTKPAQVIGYEEDYAAIVHEMPDNTNWQRPGAENEFLEKGVVRNITRIFIAIFKSAKRRPF